MIGNIKKIHSMKLFKGIIKPIVDATAQNLTTVNHHASASERGIAGIRQPFLNFRLFLI